jgi:hypothetical protein
MINFRNIPARVRNTYASRFEPEGVRPLADTYWRVLIVTAISLLILASVFGLWKLFGVVDTLSSLSDTSPPPPAAFSRAALHNVATGFDARQVRLEAFVTTAPPAIPDPSK